MYFDDCLLFPHSEVTINNLIKSLSKTFLLQDEGDVAAFLGIQLCKDVNSKAIFLSQSGLIEVLIKDIGYDQLNKGRDTPVDSILYTDS